MLLTSKWVTPVGLLTTMTRHNYSHTYLFVHFYPINCTSVFANFRKPIKNIVLT